MYRNLNRVDYPRPSSLFGKKGFYLTVVISLFMPLLHADEYAELRQQMVEVIEADVRETSRYLGSETLDPRVIKAMGNVKRHEFVPELLQRFAYANRPLPIGCLPQGRKESGSQRRPSSACSFLSGPTIR